LSTRSSSDRARWFLGLAISCAAVQAVGDVTAAVGPRQARPDPAVVAVLQDAAVKRAIEEARVIEPRTLDDQVEITEVPAPPFKEAGRAEVMRKKFVEAGLRNVRVDGAGNVIGERPGLAPRPNLVLAAHLDTVFPEGTPVRVTREGPVLSAPGIGDDGRGLAVLLAVARALAAGGVSTPGTITFVANVGEEGLGDLRGAKHLFAESLKGRIDRFVSIDGTGHGITHIAVGSLRYRVTFKGPGGHSYGAFGLVNPIHALGRLIGRVADFQVPSSPKTTFNVGRIGGGTSVNSIAFDAWLEIDMRSPDAASLRAVDAKFHDAVASALAEERERWGSAALTVTTDLVGERPAGRTPADAPIVQTAVAITEAMGLPVRLGDGSTDSNVPIGLGIPAITVGGGGIGRGAHSLTESFDSTDSWKGTQRIVALAAALARDDPR